MSQERGKDSKASTEKVHLGDWPGIKRAIDDQAVEALKRAGYEVSYTLVDTRTALGVVAVLVACIGQFWQGEHKNSPYVLAPCVVTYFFLTVLIWILQTYVQKDAIAYTKHHPGNPGIVLRSIMKRFDDQYTLKACMKGEGVVRESSSTQYIGNFFNENAELQLDSVSVFVNDVLHQLDVPSESSNGTKKDS